MAPPRIAFFGTPAPAADGVLKKLLQSTRVNVQAVVAQPARRAGRGRSTKHVSAVERVAREAGFDESDSSLLLPPSPSDGSLRDALSDLPPLSACITAAYGHLLPADVLSVPSHGFVNLHPSLLPSLRGAAPVARAIEAGYSTTGVSLAFTVSRMDAGNVIAQRPMTLSDNDDTISAMHSLFDDGGELLLEHIDAIADGSARSYAWEQDERQATFANKLSKSEGVLDFSSLSAQQAHNRVRAFKGWPGSSSTFVVCNASTDAWENEVTLKILGTEPPGSRMCSHSSASSRVALSNDGSSLGVPCADGKFLEVVELQPPSKGAMEPKAFMNGLKDRYLRLPHR